MSQVMSSLLAFIVALALLIAIHEWGHFWVARRLGVKVLRFSIGFGRPLWRRIGRDGTEYRVAMIPLGGYVKMLDEREGPVVPSERQHAFNRQSVSVRAAIVSAGPIANLLLAIALYWLVLCLGVPGMRSLIDTPAPNTPAAVAGLEGGDEILRVNDASTPTWEQLGLRVVQAALDDVPLELQVRRADGAEQTLILDADWSNALDEPARINQDLGLAPYQPPLPAQLGALQSDGPAASAGLAPGDRILAMDGRPVADWADWVNQVRARPNEAVEIEISSGDETRRLTLRIGSRQQDGIRIGYVGASPHVPQQLQESLRAEYRYAPIAALPVAVQRTWQMSVMTVRMLARMATGQLGLDNLSGPINIAQYAGYSAQIGLVSYLGFLAVISISLGVLNLLPIPILDGGHLAFYLMEGIRGKPLSERVQHWGQQIGIIALVLMMGLAFYNDLVRLFAP
ncbi:RIP metalloprotease RseP [Candidatus Macondimonas diazotrophica]|jgi:regulator of sigma E protease|uniref:Zinc metalloprotease n=1 Tax=Candidatus Macondimonas diazotrophica TaxID=2305248 RepID=A0A4Z0FBQ8_9GAMM|nr:RIP metalloprotease RseP [Candidatus Macondimonas diazotrophica]NCU00915.1 RIP metalloprotease RseP [Candidatus Macondimonas diazotrophica]TFZ83257.1 RIP metalloprotease RseP [Candidatus Macondimonas diazotrophica]HBG30333.1 RIP metalloprotease RseP [Gammaproteobacteria bacterium]HBG52082.1 RIP metalloprotease RseP [Gammaproteobacteria bacterium]